MGTLFGALMTRILLFTGLYWGDFFCESFNLMLGMGLPGDRDGGVGIASGVEVCASIGTTAASSGIELPTFFFTPTAATFCIHVLSSCARVPCCFRRHQPRRSRIRALQNLGAGTDGPASGASRSGSSLCAGHRLRNKASALCMSTSPINLKLS